MAFAFSIASVAFASTDVDYDNLPDSTQENQRLIEIGKNAQRLKLFRKTLNVPIYYQNNGNSWDDIVLEISDDEVKTMASHGCTICSFAMITRYYGWSDDPGQVFYRLGSSAYPFDYGPAGTAYGLSIASHIRTDELDHQYVDVSTANAYLSGAIETDRPALVGVYYYDQRNKLHTHFVTAYGYTDNGSTILINDPWHPRNYTTLQQYTNSGWKIHRLYVYQ